MDGDKKYDIMAKIQSLYQLRIFLTMVKPDCALNNKKTEKLFTLGVTNKGLEIQVANDSPGYMHDLQISSRKLIRYLRDTSSDMSLSIPFDNFMANTKYSKNASLVIAKKKNTDVLTMCVKNETRNPADINLPCTSGRLERIVPEKLVQNEHMLNILLEEFSLVFSQAASAKIEYLDIVFLPGGCEFTGEGKNKSQILCKKFPLHSQLFARESSDDELAKWLSAQPKTRRAQKRVVVSDTNPTFKIPLQVTKALAKVKDLAPKGAVASLYLGKTAKGAHVMTIETPFGVSVGCYKLYINESLPH